MIFKILLYHYKSNAIPLQSSQGSGRGGSAGVTGVQRQLALGVYETWLVADLYSGADGEGGIEQ